MTKAKRAEKSTGNANGDKLRVAPAGQLARKLRRAGLKPDKSWPCLPCGQFPRADSITKGGAGSGVRDIHLSPIGNVRESPAHGGRVCGSVRAGE